LIISTNSLLTTSDLLPVSAGCAAGFAGLSELGFLRFQDDKIEIQVVIWFTLPVSGCDWKSEVF